MRTLGLAQLLSVLVLMRRPASASTRFKLADAYIGDDFLQSSNWQWWTADDPTNGRVNYVSKSTALSKNLTYGTLPSLNPPRLPIVRCLNTASGTPIL